jgi:hypothetical protein
LAVAANGDIYVPLVGPGANQIVVLSPRGSVLARAPSAVQNATLAVPFDEPSSVRFVGERMIVTNDPYFDGDPGHWVLFDVWAGIGGQPIYVPPGAKPRRPRGHTRRGKHRHQSGARSRRSKKHE